MFLAILAALTMSKEKQITKQFFAKLKIKRLLSEQKKILDYSPDGVIIYNTKPID